MKLPASLAALLVFALAAQAEVVRPAPDFTFPAAGGASRGLKSLRGQSVVLVMADTPKNGDFRKELKWLHETYTTFAGKQVIFVAAFKQGEGPVKSDIPFLVANNGASVVSAYGITGKFGLAVIGKDGNIDCLTTKVTTGERVYDVIRNSFPIQAAARKGQ
jgi:peroxiredoxin